MPGSERTGGPARRGRARGSARARRARVRRRRGAVLAIVAAATALAVALLAGHGQSPARQPAERPAQVRAGAGAATASLTRGGAAAAGHRAPTGYPESAEVRALIARGKPIYCAGRGGNEVALTFDDGPGPYTRLMIAKLRKHGVDATFFIVGRNIPLVPGATRAERALGAVGDHTFTHPLLTGLGAGAAEAEIVRTQDAVARSSGGPVFLFRPPYGAHDATVDGIVRAHGLLEILWNVDSADSLGANYAQIERTVIAGMRPGAIILMHENHGQTIRAMLSIFAALQRKHMHAVSVPQLLTDDPPSAAQLRAGGLGCGVRGASGLTGG
jgi:peptidoglycan/xylan/chitin deacetylase (PgdA/CDA1 family)